MKVYFALSCLLTALVCLSEARPEALIVQGDIAQEGQFPWHASIHIARGPNQFILYAGGSLISPNFVLTGAKLLQEAQIAQVHLGSVRFSTPAVSLETRTFIIHPQFNPTYQAFDIALVQLPRSVQYTRNILPVRLPTRTQQSQTFEGFNGLVSGFGVNSSSSVFLSEQLRYAGQVVISNAQCSLTHSPDVLGNTVLCATGAITNQWQSACFGDTGGALVVDDSRQLTQIGLVSFFSKHGCDSALPVGYTRIAPALDWISATANIPIWP